jgi:hypothetical protein
MWSGGGLGERHRFHQNLGSRPISLRAIAKQIARLANFCIMTVFEGHF